MIERGRKILEPAGRCIYCDATDGLSVEHIVPFSLGGDVELPDASCSRCRDITSRIELKVARNQLHIPRAIRGFPSRRRKGYPTKTPILFHAENGKKFKRDVPIDIAPASHIVPVLPIVSGLDEQSECLASCSSFEARGRANNTELTRRLCKKYRALKATHSSGSTDPTSFYRLLWKIASGMFWYVDRESYLQSKCRQRVLHAEDIFIKPVPICPRKDIGGHSHCADVFTVEREGPVEDPSIGWLQVYHSDDGRWMFCKIDMLQPLGFPVYVCRIPTTQPSSSAVGPLPAR